MAEKLLRIYKYLDAEEIKNQLLVCGDLSGQCGYCQHLGVKLDAVNCPQCNTPFKFLAFRNIKDHLPKIQRWLKERPQLVIIDLDDYKRATSLNKAEEFFK